MDFKKLALATMVAGALAGCNSSDDNNSGSGGNDDQDQVQKVEAVFRDAQVVKGVTYHCNNGAETGETDSKGIFTVTSDSACVMSIDGFVLGRTRAITEQNKVISSAQLFENGISPVRSGNDAGEEPVGFHARVASLLQSIGSAHDSTEYIDTTKTAGSSIPPELFTAEVGEDDFMGMLEKVEVDGENLTTDDIIPPSDAEENVRGGYESEAVQRVISQVSRLLSGHAMETHWENELRDIRNELESYEITSNGLHQEALLAILEILEVVNSPEVSNRIDIEGSRFNYSDMLPKALDYTSNDDAKVLFRGELGSTDDVAVVLFEAANRLVTASQKLGNAFPNEEYELPYEELSLNYQDALYLRAYALNVANALSVAAAYNVGDDGNLVPRDFEANISVHEGWWDWDNGGFQYRTNQTTVETDYSEFSADDRVLINDSSVFTLRRDGKYLEFAKQALKASIPLIQDLDLELDEEQKKFINDLEKHLNAEDGDKTPLVIDDDGEDIFINLHAFYDVNKGLDRRAFDISFNGYSCSEGVSGGYDATYSKIFDDTMCSHDENIVLDEEFAWKLTRTVGYYYDKEIGHNIQQVVPAVYANSEIDVIPNHNRLKDVVWCGFEEGEKVSCEFED